MRQKASFWDVSVLMVTAIVLGPWLETAVVAVLAEEMTMKRCWDLFREMEGACPCHCAVVVARRISACFVQVFSCRSKKIYCPILTLHFDV